MSDIVRAIETLEAMERSVTNGGRVVYAVPPDLFRSLLAVARAAVEARNETRCGGPDVPHHAECECHACKIDTALQTLAQEKKS